VAGHRRQEAAGIKVTDLAGPPPFLHACAGPHRGEDDHEHDLPGVLHRLHHGRLHLTQAGPARPHRQHAGLEATEAETCRPRAFARMIDRPCPTLPNSNEAPAGHRLESDSMGRIPVPNDRYYGAQDGPLADPFRHRLRQNSARGRPLLCGAEKGLCALVNQDWASSSPRSPISSPRPRTEVSAGKLDDHFPLRVWPDRQRHAEQL